MSTAELIDKLILASHILHYHDCLDALGHISFRSPDDPDRFFMPRDLAPALVSSATDIVEYQVVDAEPVLADAPPGYRERHIHSEIYKAKKDVMSICHSHDPAVVPYSLVGSGSLRSVYHMAGFLESGVPIWDIKYAYMHQKVPPHSQDMLVKTSELGRALAQYFGRCPSLVLMRGHGYTTVAESIEMTVYQAIYAQQNANIQSRAMTLGATAEAPVQYLSSEEIVATIAMARGAVRRAWPLWVREVERCPIYEHGTAVTTG